MPVLLASSPTEASALGQATFAHVWDPSSPVHHKYATRRGPSQVPFRDPTAAGERQELATPGSRSTYPSAPQFAYGYVAGFQPLPLALNEIMADNATTLEDPDEPGEYPDWFELHNYGPVDIDLGGLDLADTGTDPMQLEVTPGVRISAGGYVVFYAESPFPNHDRINVNWADGSMMRAKLAHGLFEAAGIRPPAAEIVLLTLNGDYRGVYTRNEQVDEGFLVSSGRSPTGFDESDLVPRMIALHYTIMADAQRDWCKLRWEDPAGFLDSSGYIASFVTLRKGYLHGEMQFLCPAG